MAVFQKETKKKVKLIREEEYPQWRPSSPWGFLFYYKINSSAFFGGKESGEKPARIATQSVAGGETAVLARAVANSYRGLAKISETTGSNKA